MSTKKAEKNQGELRLGVAAAGDLRWAEADVTGPNNRYRVLVKTEYDDRARMLLANVRSPRGASSLAMYHPRFKWFFGILQARSSTEITAAKMAGSRHPR